VITINEADSEKRKPVMAFQSGNFGPLVKVGISSDFRVSDVSDMKRLENKPTCAVDTRCTRTLDCARARKDSMTICFCFGMKFLGKIYLDRYFEFETWQPGNIISVLFSLFDGKSSNLFNILFIHIHFIIFWTVTVSSAVFHFFQHEYSSSNIIELC
jgi:hypothetical protein